MTTSTAHLPAPAQAFRIPIQGAIPGAPFITGPTELEVTLRAGASHPERVVVRFRPEATEFQLKLWRWAKAERVAEPARVSIAAAQAQPMLEYQADAALLAALKGDLPDEAALAAYLQEAPPLLDWAHYRLAAIAFETRR